MRKTARGNRAPLAPLHNNSLRSDSPRKAAKGDGKDSLNSFGQKAAKKLHTAQLTKADKADARLPDRAYGADSKAARTKSPAKARKSVQLVTTSAVRARSATLARIKQGLKKPEAPSAKQTAAKAPSAVDGVLDQHRTARKSGALQSAKSDAMAPAIAEQAVPGTITTGSLQKDATTPSCGVLRHWQVPSTPPSINTLLGPPETTPGAITTGRDVQYLTTQATPAVNGVGTPQDFSDVFDLDEVSLVSFMLCNLHTCRHTSLDSHLGVVGGRNCPALLPPDPVTRQKCPTCCTVSLLTAACLVSCSIAGSGFRQDVLVSTHVISLALLT